MLAHPDEVMFHDKERENSDGDESDPEVNLKTWPDILTALKERDQINEVPEIPSRVVNRIQALKNIQLESLKIEARFHEEVHKLESKYNELLSTLYSQREDVVSGSYEPSEQESKLPTHGSKGVELNSNLYSKLNILSDLPTDVLGIPGFWLVAIKNAKIINDIIQPYDEPILKYLLDIKVIYKPADPMGFMLLFRFGQNDYFSNYVLTKEYEMKCKPDEYDPYLFEGAEISRSKGCAIDWYKGKNVTVKVIKKKQKNKSHSTARNITKIVPNESFFNFFNPPKILYDDGNMDDEAHDSLIADFEIANYIRERIIPRAVLFFTGEIVDEDESDNDSSEESSYGSETDGDEDNCDSN